MAQRYPGAGKDAIDLLDKILVFNPYFRLTLDDALAHPFFAKVRKPEKEKVSHTHLKMEFEHEDLNTKRLRQLFMAEITLFHKN